MKKLLAFMLILAIAGTAAYLTVPEFGEAVRALLKTSAYVPPDIPPVVYPPNSDDDSPESQVLTSHYGVVGAYPVDMRPVRSLAVSWGNLVDRITRGEVIDFLDVYVSSPRLGDWLIERFGTAHWPTFNVADSAIVTGAGLLLLTVLLPHPAPATGEPESTV